MLLDDTTPCWGRAGAPICTDCARLQARADYAGHFPAMNLLVPGAHLRADYLRGKAVGPPQWFCTERRSAGAPRPAAVCGAVGGGVCAPADCVHSRTLGVPAHQGKPLSRGG